MDEQIRAKLAKFQGPLGIVAIILGVVVRGDTIQPIAIAGATLVLLGAWITSRKET